AIEGDASPHRSGSLSLPGLEGSNAGPENEIPSEGGEIRETLRLEVDATNETISKSTSGTRPVES
ncbi:MAG: hypothetical protein VX726_09440, partial [Planctomycetota bacterium]|nr:hypothetical protein [Planctomycetota bacterium]